MLMAGVLVALLIAGAVCLVGAFYTLIATPTDNGRATALGVIAIACAAVAGIVRAYGAL